MKLPGIQDDHIKGLIRGEACAFDEIFRIYSGKVYSFSLKNLKNKEDAESVVQEVFYSLWEGRLRLKQVRNLDAWIFTVSYNIIRKRFRDMVRERQHLQQFADLALSEDNTTMANIEFNDLLKKAEEVIEKLPVRQRLVFTLSKKEGLSNTEISSRLRINKKTVENHLTKARSFIRKALVDERLI